MTQRERYHRFITHQKPADIPLWGDWVGPYEAWVAQGLPPAPEGYKGGGGQYLLDYFGFEGKYSAFWGSARLPVNLGIMPGFEFEVLEKDENYMIYRNYEGMVVKEMSHKDSTLVTQQYIDHALHGSSDWPTFRDKHLVIDHPGRYPDEQRWKRIVELCKTRDYVVTVDGGSFYGYLRNWMSVEGVSYAMCEEPEWIREAVDFLADHIIAILTRAVTDVPDIDMAMFWEDMCFKTGPLCSPAMFREFFLPGYKRVTKFLRGNGVASFWVDCDGNIDQLIDLWIEGGVNGFYPLERASDMDAYALKQKYGDRIVLWGGIDKRAIAAGGEAIERELLHAKKAVELGGYIPLCDHGVPDDVSFENFCHYDRRRKEMFGLKPLPTNNIEF
jgi:uroporphyrinogen decarboxylase